MITYSYFKPKEYDKNWLTKNHKEPRLLFKHSGVFDLEKKLVLFVVTGFDESRLIQLIEYYEPNKLVVFVQSGEQFDNAARNKSMIGRLTAFQLEINEVEIDSYDVQAASKILNDQIDASKDYNVILASQGPKTSSLSIYLTYLKSSKKIGLAYVPARDFNKQYSNGINENFVSGAIEI